MQKTVLPLVLIPLLICIFFSCNKEQMEDKMSDNIQNTLDSIIGIYSGQARIIEWGFITHYDEYGNFEGYEQFKDTTENVQGNFIVEKSNANNFFSFEGTGGLLQIQNLDSQELLFDTSGVYELMENSIPYWTKEINFTIDENKDIVLDFIDEIKSNGDTPPKGFGIMFMGEK